MDFKFYMEIGGEWGYASGNRYIYDHSYYFDTFDELIKKIQELYFSGIDYGWFYKIGSQCTSWGRGYKIKFDTTTGRLVPDNDKINKIRTMVMNAFTKPNQNLSSEKPNKYGMYIRFYLDESKEITVHSPGGTYGSTRYTCISIGVVTVEDEN